MINQEDTIRGFYNPNFFSVYFDGKFYEDISKMQPLDLGTFAHEYLHFLQNLTTLYGLKHGIFYYQFLFETKDYFSKSSSISIPLKLDFLSERLKKGKQQFDFYDGTKISENVKYENYDVKVVSRNLLGDLHSIVEIEFINNDHKPKSIVFGGICVKESMARMFQLEFDSAAEAFNIPYDTADLIVSKINPCLINERQKIFVYLYLSLFSNNPGLTFYKLILDSKKDFYLSAREIYRNFFKTTSVTGKLKKDVPLKEYFKEVLKEFRLLLDLHSTGKIDHFNKLFENIDCMFSSEGITFLEILINQEIGNIEKLQFLINQFGIPSIRTSDGCLHFSGEGENPAIEFVDFMAQHVVIERLFKSKVDRKVCSMFAICIEENDLVDECCDEQQWKRTVPCPFKVISDSWGLNAKIIDD
ncbi:hypothetical protein SAMN00777080_3498 [Aquiflexum balticum DSM 16537]|uniref:Uncharacterized protein n=1 Tax=Aquiflexum balticum DSM 16537 TaxID=758820 RepID=A0A1W2H882_9BACT|nr:hypothetical protein [Aquiflexum balticum]SMD44862.1 hypothetical protein SAMN00777080_3498 [Aquiflexum balticum DSM 16537]